MLLPLVCAVPPVTTVQSFAQGYVIEYAPKDYAETNHNYTVNFFVRNISNGVLINNDSTNCTFYMANSYGELLLQSNVTYSNGYWHTFIDKGNFSTSGIFPYGIACEGENLGGEATGAWEVNAVGYGLTTAAAIFDFIGIVILMFIFFITFFGINMLPARNERDEEGKLLSISYLKYFRNVLWMFEWMLIITILFVSSNLTLAFLGTQIVGKVLFMLFHISLAVTPVIVIIWFVWIIVSMFHDKQLQNLLNRGMMGGNV